MSIESFLQTPCPQCGRAVKFPREHLGRQIACPHCAAVVQLEIATATPAPARLLIDPKAAAIPVAGCGTATALLWLAVLEFIVAVPTLFLNGFGGALALVVSAIITLGLAKLVQCAHESTARLARLEVFFQTVVNERR